MSERKTHHGALTRAIVGVTASMSLVVGIATAAVTVRWIQARDEGTEPFHVERGDPGSQAPIGECAQEACNYLLLGSDSRTGLPDEFGTNSDIGGTTRADTIMLVHTDPRLKKAIVLSFPRDLWVKIPGRGFDKINTAFEGGVKGGGPQLMAKTIADLTRLTVHHYVYLDLDGFRNIVNTLGGVDMCIPAYNVNTPGWLTGTARGRETDTGLRRGHRPHRGPELRTQHRTRMPTSGRDAGARVRAIAPPAVRSRPRLLADRAPATVPSGGRESDVATQRRRESAGPRVAGPREPPTR